MPRHAGKKCICREAVFPVWLMLLLSFCWQPAQADSLASLRQGIEKYRARDYNQALKLLAKASEEDPYNAEAHYYLANAHVFLHDGNAAMAEYSRCFELEPLSNYGQYSRQALLAFGKKFQGLVSNRAVPQKNREHLAPDDPKSIKQAVEMIRAQTCERDRLHHEQAEGAAKTAVSAAEAAGQRINQSASELLEDLTPPNKQLSPALEEELHEIQQKAAFAGQRARLDGQQQAHQHMSAATQRSAHVEKSASNLLYLIGESPKPGHVKVKAAGTNLYVRNYGMEPRPPLQPLQAEWSLLEKDEFKSKHP
ncbi:MAG: tetratricopeptide repeat protein, partial [Candidatus Obscuribacterales bacterium]|nr:tetratricopeptide repeat protein [Candidatus Obscuribacterales bacterium]